MIINKDVIKGLKPCVDRYTNWLENYSDLSGSFDEFIELDKISYNDKIWVAKNLLNKNQLVHFGIMCAESVLYIFEEKYPEDRRVRECIDLLKSKKDFSNLTSEERKEIYQNHTAAATAATCAYAANAVYYAAAAADTAAYAATCAAAADTAAYAAYAATAATCAAAAYYATYAANAADTAAKLKQENLNLQFLKLAASL